MSGVMGAIMAHGILLTKSVKDILAGGKDLENSDLSALGEQADNLGGGAYNLVFKASVYIIVIGLILAGLKLAFSNSNTRTEAKGNIVWAIIGAIFVFGAVGIVIFLQTLGGGLFSSTAGTP